MQNQNRKFSEVKAQAYKFPVPCTEKRKRKPDLSFVVSPPAASHRAQWERLKLFRHWRSTQHCLCQHPRTAILSSSCYWHLSLCTEEFTPWIWCKYGAHTSPLTTMKWLQSLNKCTLLPSGPHSSWRWGDLLDSDHHTQKAQSLTSHKQ